MSRSHRIRQTLQPPKLAIRVTTAVIVLLGLAALVWAISPSERRRRSDMEALQIAADSTRVLSLLGPQPARCPVGGLEHLEESFPAGWAPAAIAVTLEQLRADTSQRWAYSLDPEEPARCEVTEGGRTEIGIGPDGRVLWYIAVTGKTTLELPGEYAPAGVSAPAGR